MMDIPGQGFARPGPRPERAKRSGARGRAWRRRRSYAPGAADAPGAVGTCTDRPARSRPVTRRATPRRRHRRRAAPARHRAGGGASIGPSLAASGRRACPAWTTRSWPSSRATGHGSHPATARSSVSDAGRRRLAAAAAPPPMRPAAAAGPSPGGVDTGRLRAASRAGSAGGVDWRPRRPRHGSPDAADDRGGSAAASAGCDRGARLLAGPAMRRRRGCRPSAHRDTWRRRAGPTWAPPRQPAAASPRTATALPQTLIGAVIGAIDLVAAEDRLCRRRCGCHPRRRPPSPDDLGAALAAGAGLPSTADGVAADVDRRGDRGDDLVAAEDDSPEVTVAARAASPPSFTDDAAALHPANALPSTATALPQTLTGAVIGATTWLPPRIGPPGGAVATRAAEPARPATLARPCTRPWRRPPRPRRCRRR